MYLLLYFLPQMNKTDYNLSCRYAKLQSGTDNIGETSSALQQVAPSIYSMYSFSYQIPPHGTQFYLVELRSTAASLLDSQPH